MESSPEKGAVSTDSTASGWRVFKKFFLDEYFHTDRFANAASDVFDLFFGQFRKHRQRKKFVGEFLRYWECALCIAEIATGLLEMNRNRIMHCAPDSLFLEMSQGCVAFLYPNGIDVINVPRVLRLQRCKNFVEGAKIFPGIKTEATRVSYRACFSAFVLCAMRLSGIFNDEKSVCACKFQNRVHVRWLPEKVNRNDRFGSLGQTLFKFRRVHRECILVYIYKHWSGLAVGDRLGSGDKRVRNRNDFIAFANSQRQESKPKRISAVAHAYRVGGPAE